jgi:hypothetical protein
MYLGRYIGLGARIKVRGQFYQLTLMRERFLYGVKFSYVKSSVFTNDGERSTPPRAMVYPQRRNFTPYI